MTNTHLNDCIGRATRRAITGHVLAEVATERIVQYDKFGQQDIPDGTSPDLAWRAEEVRAAVDLAAAEGRLTYGDILAEEVAEAVAEVDPAKLRAELVQVAAVAVAWVEAIDRRPR